MTISRLTTPWMKNPIMRKRQSALIKFLQGPLKKVIYSRSLNTTSLIKIKQSDNTAFQIVSSLGAEIYRIVISFLYSSQPTQSLYRSSLSRKILKKILSYLCQHTHIYFTVLEWRESKSVEYTKHNIHPIQNRQRSWIRVAVAGWCSFFHHASRMDREDSIIK